MPECRRQMMGPSITIWNVETGQKVARFRGLQGAFAFYLAFLEDGNTLVSATDREVRLWRAPSWDEIAAAEAKENNRAQ